MYGSQNRAGSTGGLSRTPTGFFKNQWKRLVLGLIGILLLILVGICAWVLMPIRQIAVPELLPSQPFAFFTLPLDKSDPSVKLIVSRLKDRLGSGHGLARKTLVKLLLSVALPNSFVAVGTLDAGTGAPQIVAYARMGRFSRLLKLCTGPASKVLLRGGPIARERIAGQVLRHRRNMAALSGFSAMAIIGNVLVLGTSREAVLDCYTQYRSKEKGNFGRRAFGAMLLKAQATQDPALYVDNGTGRMSRLVHDVSDKYAFAVFPSIDAVSSISGSFRILPELLSGTVSFSSPSGAQIETVSSDVKFVYGAIKRVVRAGGLNMKGEIDVKENAVLFSFQIPDYMGALAAPVTTREGEAE